MYDKYIYARIQLCMCLGMYGNKYKCKAVYNNVCVYICMYVFMCVCKIIFIYVRLCVIIYV